MARRALGWTVYALAALALGLSWALVGWHAQGVQALEGLRVDWAGMQWEPGPKAQLTIRLDITSTSGHPLVVTSVRLVTYLGDAIVGTRPAYPLAVPAGRDPVRIALPLELHPEGPATLAGAADRAWLVKGYLDVRLPRSRRLWHREFVVRESLP
ncbi:MAG: hypothetical protein AB1445_04825 [Bacillota bacterium]